MTVDVEESEGTGRPGMILISGAAGINKGNTMDNIEKRMVRMAEDDAVHLLTEDVLGLLRIAGPLVEVADVVCDADLEAIQVFDADIRQPSEIELEAISTDGQDLAIAALERLDHVLALEVARVNDHVDSIELFQNSLRHGVGALPVCVGKHCNSHARVPPDHSPV